MDIIKDIIYLFIPVMSVYLVSLLYPVTNNAGKSVSFRPPPYVFAIVWPILLLLIGYSWILREDITLFYFILTLLLSCWSIVFTYSKLLAFYEIILTIIFALIVCFYKFQVLSSLLLIPLILWLSFASVLNYYSIEYIR